MKAEDLRKSILQAAVQGKLVPQDKNDEPASELLKRIQQEKAHLVTDGVLKKEKQLPSITEDEIPYDLPDGWEWCRFGDIIYSNVGGGTPSKQHQEYWNGDISWASVKDLNCDILSKTIDTITQLGLDNSSSNLIPAGSIIICTRMGLGKIAINAVPVAINQDLRAISVSNGKVSEKYLIDWYKTLDIIGGGMTVKGITINELNNILFPFPPFAEQQRIVAKVDELMALCDRLESAEYKLDVLEDHLTEDLPMSILQAAVQGKLVPQDKKDEPAYELLKRIQVEKAARIKVGKEKKEKSLPPITDEIPYDLPDGWAWCRLSEIGHIVGGATPSSTNKEYYTEPGDGIPWITPADMKLFTKGKTISHGQKDITQAGYDSCSTSMLPKGSVIYSSRAPIGLIAFAGTNICTNQGFKSIIPSKPELAFWLFIALQNATVDIIDKATGTTFKEVSGSFMEKVIIPLPPLAEQRRIVARVDELMALCEGLKHVGDKPIDYSNVIPLPVQTPNTEPLQMVAQGKVTETQSVKHQIALRDLKKMMDDE